MSTTTAPPVAPGDTFEVTQICGGPDLAPSSNALWGHYIGRRFVAQHVSSWHVYCEGVEIPFTFSEVRRVEPTEQERGLENYLLEDGE